MNRSGRPVVPLRAGPDDPWDLRKSGPPAPPSRLRGDAGRARARPEGRAGRQRRPAARPARADVGGSRGGRSRLRDGIRNVADFQVERLKAYWLYRIVFGHDPLREKMTLFWHGHFATSNRKVQNVERMLAQNELFRRHALGDFRELAAAILSDPAMLVWLDGVGNSEGEAQREPGAGVPRALHAGRRPLHRGRHPPGGPGADRLAEGRRRGRLRGPHPLRSRAVRRRHQDVPRPDGPWNAVRHRADRARAAGGRRRTSPASSIASSSATTSSRAPS